MARLASLRRFILSLLEMAALFLFAEYFASAQKSVIDGPIKPPVVVTDFLLFNRPVSLSSSPP
jgi:hypothetical protein